ncbi:MAG: glycosyltransferase family 4 protein [Chitinophagaceae bacterium]|nr:glycosyltransferase family 4 protein [Chitinophagaceae bacterium]
MNIGFDAKRAYHNQTGLGHYSRTLIQSLANGFTQHQYYLFNPKPSLLFQFNNANIHEVLPGQFLHKTFSSLWRSQFVKSDIKRLNIDLYHGLSHEIPKGIDKLNVKSVVTIHDLIHERYPNQYPFVDRKIYTAKFTYACKTANHIIAISEQTKQDIIDYYKIPNHKITVCYQSCNSAFMQKVSEQQQQTIKERYNLPDKYYLSVGSIIERKNLLIICKAIQLLKNEIPLVVIGNGGSYMQMVKKYIAGNNLQHKIIFLSEHKNAQLTSFKSAADFPAIYQLATAMIYPSSFEGFGIPVLEALNSGLPVITSNASCLPETGGNAALYVNPLNENELAEAMIVVAENHSLRAEMIEKGFAHAQNFTPEKCAASVMSVYKKL